MRLPLFAAPLQGFTDAAWRHFHRQVYGPGVEMYYTPFLRVEKQQPRPRDIRGIRSELNGGVPLTPQVIFNSAAEFTTLVDAIDECGYRAIDLNLGCPFPPQVHHGRGSALLRNPDLLNCIADLVNDRYGHIRFSVKMRLGVERPDEWRQIIPAVNRLNLTQVTVHPRVATQQYGGELFSDEFVKISDECRHPLIYNGDVITVADINQVAYKFPGVKAVMIGRGLLMRPSLAAEYAEGSEWNREKRLGLMLDFHSRLYDYYSGTLSGDAQLLSKIKPFWVYLEPEIGHKTFKQIKKATSAAKYMAAVANIE